MALKELFYDRRPVAMLNPRESRRLDSRFRYSRLSEGMYVDADRVWKAAPPNVPRFHHDFLTGQYLGMLLEAKETINRAPNSMAVGAVAGTPGTLPTHWTAGTAAGLTISVAGTGTEQGVPYADLRIQGTTANSALSLGLNCFTPTAGAPGTLPVASLGQTWTASAYIKHVAGALPISLGNRVNVTFQYVVYTSAGTPIRYASQGPLNTVNGVNQELPAVLTRYERTYTIVDSTAGLVGCSISVNNSDIGGVVDFTLRVGFPQFERNSKASTPIRSYGTAATRAADIITLDSLQIPAAGSAIIDAQLVEVTDGATLISLANASNQKVNLAVESRAETYNALATIASYTGQAKTALPLPVPSTARERSIITWGANNYQHARNISRFTPLLSAAVPAGLNRLSIGQDAVDPTKGMMGLLNAVYLMPAEINDQLAEALVQTELVPINADTYAPTGPANALSMIINTQGSNNDGSTSFTFPVRRNSVAATALVSGQTYRILSAGTTNFTLIGASANNVGTVFTATGPGTGTGTACLHHDIVITWGDGTESGLEGTAAEVGAVGLVHAYPSAGIYPVWVTGRAEQLFFNNQEYGGDLLRIESWGNNEIFKAPRLMAGTFWGCKNLTSIPASPIPDTSAVTDFNVAFSGCSSLQSVPLFNTGAATIMSSMFLGCSSLTTVPLFNTQNVTNMAAMFDGCSGLTSLPLFNTSSATSMTAMLRGCSSLAAVPLFNTANVATMNLAFQNVPAASFPLFNTANVINMAGAFANCPNITTLPAYNTSNCTNFADLVYGAVALMSFPAIDTSKGTNFSRMLFNTDISVFPALTFTSLVTGAPATPFTGFYQVCWGCNLLTTVPANLFNNVTNCTNFVEAFTDCALTAASIENILVSINAANTSNGTLGLNGGTNAGATTWTGPAVTAYNALIARGWTIVRNA